MISIFSKKNSFNIILLFVYALVIKFHFFTNPQNAVHNNGDGKLYKLLLVQISTAGSFNNLWCSIIAFFVIYLQAILISNLISKNKLLQKPNYLAGLCFVLITSMFQNWNILTSALIANTIILFVWHFILQLQNTQKPKTLVFNIGLLICFANLWYSFSFCFLILAIIGLITYRPFKLQEYIVLLLGYIVPFYCLFVYQFLTDKFAFNNYKIKVQFALLKLDGAQWLLIAVTIIATLLLLGLYYIQNQSGKMNIQSRKGWSILFFWLLISLVVPFFSADFRFSILAMLPISAFIGAAFYFTKNKKVNLFLHWALFAFAIFINYFLK